MANIINGTEGNDVLNGTFEADTINGLGGDDILFGNGGDDVLNGGAGNDMLGGDAGDDQMAGGPGDDRIIVEDPGDVAIELPGEGNDTVISMIDYTLPAGVSVENLELFAAAGSRNLTGNELSQTIRGNVYDNILTGGPIGSAPDVLIGGGGNDTFFVNNVGDTVVLGGGPVNITINSAVNFTLAADAPLTAQLTLVARGGTAAINLTGNDLNQSLIGNDGANVLLGKGGWDILTGGAGADTLDGGDGPDTVDYSRESGGGDVLVNLSSGPAAGVGSLQARDSYGTIDTLVSIEHVITGSGNDIVVGSAAADLVETGAGNDTINGLGGDDTLAGGAGADTLTGGDGADVFKGTRAELNGDLITDIAAGDRFLISDASLADFTFSLSGQTLAYSDGSISFASPLNGHFVARAPLEGGVELTFVRDARFVAFTAFDLNAVNLNWYYQFGTATSLQKYVNTSFNGQTYEDAFGVRASNGTSSGELDFLGSGFLPDANGAIIDGTVNVVAEFDLNASAFLWYVEGVSISAAALYNAAVTPSPADELTLIQAALSGNDVIVLSSFNDRMNGFAGEDTITGGLGADILTGGAGNDTFKDSAAGLSGDTITDFSAGDRILITDANIANFTFSLTGNTLSYTGGSLTLANVPNGNFVARAAPAGGVQLTIQHLVESDFNGDGYSDVFWRNDDGRVTYWIGQPNGGLATNSNFNFNPGADWHVAGTGDFNGDGYGDALWRNDIGSVVTFLGQGNGSFVGNVNFNLNPGLDWHVQGTGDFNGDGRDDILWRSDNGTVVTLLGNANGSFTGNVNFQLNPGLDWHIEGTGDFNGDHRDDILWRSDNGTVVTLLGNDNGSFTGNVNFQLNPGLDWHIEGTGDFNGDGRDDILWRSDSGTVVTLLGNANGSFTGNVNFNLNPGLDWHIIGTGDFNGDGFDDILWRSDGGTVTDLLGQPSGAFIGNIANLNVTQSPDWHVQPEAALL